MTEATTRIKLILSSKNDIKDEPSKRDFIYDFKPDPSGTTGLSESDKSSWIDSWGEMIWNVKEFKKI